MKINAVQKANILSQALPYIQKYRGKIVVIKYGGNAMKNDMLKRITVHPEICHGKPVVRNTRHLVEGIL